LGMHRRAFGQLDANRDGMVSREELAAQAQN
jgi:Ca2+-binding EF-hand superfamily protein